MDTFTKISLIVLILHLQQSIQIIVPGESENQKPLTSTSGIKTISHKKFQNQLQYHDNYSKVYHHNSENGYHSEDSNESSTLKPFPVYNAHTYGARPQTNERPSQQIYVINNTRVTGNQNPTRQILIYKKKRKAAKVEVYHECPEDSTGQFVYDLSCNQFLNCWKGRGFVQNCAPGTLFNPKSLECDYADKVECITGPRHNSYGFQRSQHVEQVGCPQEFSGLIPNYRDCSKFISCVNGIQHPMDCPPGTLFDVTQNICDFAHKAVCFNGQNENLTSGVERVNGKLDFSTSESHQGIVDSKLNFGTLCRPGESLPCQRGHNQKTSDTGHYDQGIIEQSQFGSGQNLYGLHNGHYITKKPQNYLSPSNDNKGVGSYYPGTGSYYQSQGNVNRGAIGNSQQGYEARNYFQKPLGHGMNTLVDTTRYHQELRPMTNTYDQREVSHSVGSGSQYSDLSRPDHVATGNQYLGSSGFDQSTLTDNTRNYQQESESKFGQSKTSYDRTRGSPYGYSSQGYQQGSHILDQSSTGQIERQYGQTDYGTSGYNQGTRNQFGQTDYGASGYYQGTGNQNSGSSDHHNVKTGRQYGQSSLNRDAGSHLQGSVDNIGYDTGIQHNTGSVNFDHTRNDRRYDQTASTYNGGNYNRGSNKHYGNSDSSYNTGIYHGQSGQASSSTSHKQIVKCPEGAVGIQKHPTDCSKFLNCANGQTFIQDCAPGTLFNPENNICDFPYKVRCDNDGITDSQSRRSETTIHNDSHYSGWNQNQQSGNSRRDNMNQQHNQSGQGNCNRSNNYCKSNQQSGDQTRTWAHSQAGSGTVQFGEGGIQTTTSNYQEVVNIGGHISKTPTRIPFRNSYEPFFGPTTRKPRFDQINVTRSYQNRFDYDDTYVAGHSSKYIVATTPKIREKHWPPPFPSTDVNADYVFEYEDGEEVTLEAENSANNNQNKNQKGCDKKDFHCTEDKCVSKNLVCNGVKDCSNGADEVGCQTHVRKFNLEKNHKLAVLEKERWDNVTVSTCALLCLENDKFSCKSFNYRKIDKTCFLTNTNIGLTGALISYYPCDYYERISEKIDCSSKFKCPNLKCIERSQLCDGQDDCGDRTDEKGCKPEDFGYTIKLTGSHNKHEGQIEVTAFGKTGYVCDDKFGLRDADVVCKELGFNFGAVEVKSNSFYSKNKENPFYMMDDITCSGNETRLMDCDFSGWGVHNCLGQEIAGVVCKTPQEKCPKDYWQCDTGQECLPLAFVCDGLLDCSDNSDESSRHCDAPTAVRLVNGSSSREGRVEIKHHGIWGTICDDDFNEDAAKVVCKSLGFNGSALVKKDGYFGAGHGPIWLDQVFCSGNETSVEDCTHWNWGEHNCEHSEDVGVICSKIHQTERHSLEVVPLKLSPKEIYPERCGYRKDSIFDNEDNVHFRVVKGSLAKKGDYPWQAALRVKGKTKTSHWCGAVVISEKFVLTAAHCLVGYSKGAYVVAAGDYNVDENEGTEQEAYIEDYYIHEDFRKNHKMNNDIALIKLKGKGFRFTQDVKPICLPDISTEYERDLNCTISGFGSIESGKSGFSHELRAGWIPLQSRQICTMPHVYGDALTDGMICAGSLDEGIDSCDGDSGGPLACLDNGVFTLFGITSWGQHCGYANKPGVYVKVAYYRKWIDDTIHKYWSVVK